MKKIAIVFLPLLLFACASQKDSSVVVNKTPLIQNNCPPQGACAVTVHKNKVLLVKTDGIGKLYYELSDKPGTVVIAYNYNKAKNPDYQDDFYSEEIVFETDAQFSNLNAGTMPDVFFTVNCFCRDKQGTYKVNSPEIKYAANKLYITLPQIIDNQLTKQITVLFK